MRRTSAALLAGLAVTGGGLAWLVQVGLAAAGRASFVPTPGLWSSLIVIGGAVVLFGLPVRRTVRGTARRAVDPFYAMRVLVLAKTSSLLGAFAAGAGGALVLYAVSRPDLPVSPGFWPSLALLAGGVAMLVAGVLVESWCRLPPEDRADAPDVAAQQR